MSSHAEEEGQCECGEAASVVQRPKSGRCRRESRCKSSGCGRVPTSILVLSLAANAVLATLLLRQQLGAEPRAATSAKASLTGSATDGSAFLPALDVSAAEQEAWRLGGAAARQMSTSSSTSSSTNTSGCGSSAASSHGGHHDGPHQHDTLLFLFNALVVGAAIMHLGMFFPSLQQTVVLFLLGMICSFLLKGLKVKEHIGVFGESYDMWMQIDPHLLLFTLLPALLAGDAMTIDANVASHVGMQCLYLAGPGVLINAMAAAGFLVLYLDWSFLLSLVTASILCATDPVAVVALLKELGASPTLTVQIQGESLLNDGTAIVLYTVAYNMLSGETYDTADIVMFLVKTAIMAWALGMFIGYFFFTWIRMASNRFKHSSSMIQIALTLCCAYWSFIFAEGVLKISGVLATVAASLILAQHMWPHIVSPDSLHHVWHTFESLGNIIIFFLAGALTGDTMVDISFVDYLNLIVIYIVLVLLRGILIFGSRPFMKYLSPERIAISWEDALVMTWGGLRGAVGLALAIQVHNDRAMDEDGVAQISEEDGQRVLFFVSGIAFLTTIINATTAPMLVNKLGITALPKAQLRLLKRLNLQLINLSIQENNPEAVTNSLEHLIEEVDHAVSNLRGTPKANHKKASSKVGIAPDSEPAGPGEAQGQGQANTTGERGTLKPHVQPHAPPSFLGFSRSNVADDLLSGEDTSNLYKVLKEAESKFQMRQAEGSLGRLLNVDNQGGDVCRGIPPENLLGRIDELSELVNGSPIDRDMAKVVNRTFLGLCRKHYWKQIETGDLKPGGHEAKLLLVSIQVGLSPPQVDLVDFDYVERVLRRRSAHGVEDHVNGDIFASAASVQQGNTQALGVIKQVSNRSRDHRNGLEAFVRSGTFNIIMAVLILFNCLYVAIEEAVRDDDDPEWGWWFGVEALFTVIFTGEFLLKFAGFRLAYFKDYANVFDFALVILAIFGTTMTLIEQGGTGGVGGLASVVRLSRVFRVLRFLRVFRLFHAKLSADKHVSEQLACRMHIISSLMSFVGAHLWAQIRLVQYFAANGKIDDPEEVELGRCIMQSQLSVYRAVEFVLQEEKSIEDTQLVEELKWVYERKEIIEGLEGFILSAYSDGAISSKEAESFVHPLYHQIADEIKNLNEKNQGIVKRPTAADARKSALTAEEDDKPVLLPSHTSRRRRTGNWFRGSLENAQKSITTTISASIGGSSGDHRSANPTGASSSDQKNELTG